MTIKTKYIILILSIMLTGCKDEFLLETINYEPILVVDGLISNEARPYSISLSLTSPINELIRIPFENCTVTLYESTDKSEVLTEIEPGKYISSESGMQGIVGNEYRISITTPDGKEYNTEFQEMKEPVEIDSVYAELIELEDEDYPWGLPGYQFYTDSKMASGNENYFLWKMVETFEYTANYHLYNLFNIESTLAEYQNLYRCWKTQNVYCFFTGKTSNLITPKIIHQPLHLVTTESKRLQERYSLLLKQYSIGEDAYSFWKSVEDQVSEENFLFAYQAYNIIGNIKNESNNNEVVFGNFTIASVSQKRIFIDRPRVAFYYEKTCALNYDYERLISFGYPVFLIQLEDEQKAKVNEWCVNCTFDGGITNKPDFWIDK